MATERKIADVVKIEHAVIDPNHFGLMIPISIRIKRYFAENLSQLKEEDRAKAAQTLGEEIIKALEEQYKPAHC